MQHHYSVYLYQGLFVEKKEERVLLLGKTKGNKRVVCPAVYIVLYKSYSACVDLVDLNTTC